MKHRPHRRQGIGPEEIFKKLGHFTINLKTLPHFRDLNDRTMIDHLHDENFVGFRHIGPFFPVVISQCAFSSSLPSPNTLEQCFQSHSEMSSASKKTRQYLEEYLKFGFIPAIQDKRIPLCLLCQQFLSNESMKRGRL
ncbi:hypothetical protein TNCV_3136071 [Trichonephila clavipes]|nr:hypothetical protein TNCV_3136071 [Trichonephila clavipes]